MFTLTTSDKHGIYDGKRIRILAPLEYERLQGFPVDWTKYGAHENGSRKVMSDSQRYKCLGNAVTVPMVTAIAERMFGTGRSQMMKGIKTSKQEDGFPQV